MIGYECLLRGAGRLVIARDPAHGDEVVATARAVSADANAWARFAELASLIAFALRPRRARTVWVEGALLAAAVALLAAITPLALALPFVLLGLGVYDARPAAAATLFWLWRLLTADVGALLAALGEPSTAVLRWVLMLIGLAVAAHVTRSSIRRSAAL